MTHWVHNRDALLDFIAHVYVRAPNRFRQHIGPMNLQIAFDELRYGLDCSESEIGDAAIFEKAKRLVDEAFVKYGAGERIEGAHLLQDLEDLLTGRNEENS